MAPETATSATPAPAPEIKSIFAPPVAETIQEAAQPLTDLGMAPVDMPPTDIPQIDLGQAEPVQTDLATADLATADFAPENSDQADTGPVETAAPVDMPPPGPDMPAAPAYEATTFEAPVEPPLPEGAQPQPTPQIASIFAPPASSAPEPEQMQPDPIPEPEPMAPPAAETAAQGGTFASLLDRVHGSSLMGAPGEPDQPQPAETGPEPEPEAVEGPSAADLATRNGDHSMAGLLGASAAWLTLVKRQHRFSRRDVMEVLETIPAETPRTLADRIKGFGKLVRSGHVVLIDDGVFALTQTQRDRFQGLVDHP